MTEISKTSDQYDKASDNDNFISNEYADNRVCICEEALPYVKCHITGKNNIININKISPSSKGIIEIWLRGNDNSIFIDEGLCVNSKLIITLGRIHKNFGPITNTKVAIGKNNGIGSLTIVTYNSASEISIGDGCMFAFNTLLYHTDGHPIIDKETNKIINKVKDTRIGNHVWIGGNVTILKNTVIPDDCICGLGSVVSGNYEKKGTGKTGYVIAGNPAKIIKENITWTFNGSGEYVDNI